MSIHGLVTTPEPFEVRPFSPDQVPNVDDRVFIEQMFPAERQRVDREAAAEFAAAIDETVTAPASPYILPAFVSSVARGHLGRRLAALPIRKEAIRAQQAIRADMPGHIEALLNSVLQEGQQDDVTREKFPAFEGEGDATLNTAAESDITIFPDTVQDFVDAHLAELELEERFEKVGRVLSYLSKVSRYHATLISIASQVAKPRGGYEDLDALAQEFGLNNLPPEAILNMAISGLIKQVATPRSLSHYMYRQSYSDNSNQAHHIADWEGISASNGSGFIAGKHYSVTEEQLRSLSVQDLRKSLKGPLHERPLQPTTVFFLIQTSGRSPNGRRFVPLESGHEMTYELLKDHRLDMYSGAPSYPGLQLAGIKPSGIAVPKRPVPLSEVRQLTELIKTSS